MDLEVRHLKLVREVSAAGSLTRAGAALHLTQSALSHQLRDIESRLGTPLFLRVGKRMLLTPAGERLRRSADEVLSTIERTEDAIRQLGGAKRGVLRLTTECYTCYHWLPALLKRYRRTHPQVDVRIDVAATAQPLAHLLEGRLDIAIVSDPVRDRRVVARPLFEDEVVVVVAPGHPLAARPFVRPEAIHDEVLPFPERYRNLAASLASQAGVAIQNAQLLEELRVALQELELQQQQMVQTERLSALGEMAAGVAHDFNNLLAVVVGRADLLLGTVREPEISQNLEIIRQAAWDGAQTVRRIQEFSRTRQTRPGGRVDIPELLREVIELTRGRWKDEAQSRGLSYEMLVEGGPVSQVAGISAELREVFMNLLINALDAMPGGGRFVFRVSSDTETVTIAAEDTGCGMSDEVRWRVLEPFFTTKGSRGTGLGLSVSWGIVKRHGGTIDIESSLGVGSTFVVRLPVSKEEPAAEAPESAPRHVRRARVLVIDDEPEIRGVLRDMLTSFGHTVVEAASGEEGLACCDSAGMDVILTDVSMPGLSGWDVAAECRRRFPLVPLGFVTGWGDSLDPEETLRSGVRFVLSKPFAPVDLQSLVAGVLLPDSSG